MKNAFLLIVHTNYDQLLQMMKCLDYAENDFYIHVNALVDNIPYGFLESEICAAKIKYVKRHEIYWGGVWHIRGLDRTTQISMFRR